MTEVSDEAKAWQLTAAAIAASHRADTWSHFMLALLILCHSGLIVWIELGSRAELLQETRRNQVVSQNQNVNVQRPRSIEDMVAEELAKQRVSGNGL